MLLIKFIFNCFYSLFYFKIFIKRKQKKDITKKKILITIIPWYLNTTPFFLIYLSNLCQISKGYELFFVFDDISIKGTVVEKIEIFLIKSILLLTIDKENLFFISNFKENIHLKFFSNKQIIKKIYQNFTHDLFTDNVVKYKDLYINTKLSIKKISRIENFYNNFHNKFNVVFIPGGLFKSSWIFFKLSTSYNHKVITFDSGGYSYPFNNFCFSNGLVTMQDELNKSLDFIYHSEYIKNFILKLSIKEIMRRVKGKDKLLHQNVSIKKSYNLNEENYVLILLSVSWDGPSLASHKFHNNLTQWLLDTIKYIRKISDIKIIIRQHPHERFSLLSSKNNYAFLNNFSNCLIVTSDEKISTYNLIKKSKFVIGHNSTSLLESVYLNKKIVSISSLPSIKKLCPDIETLNDYYSYIKELIFSKENLKPSLLERKRSLFLFFLSQKCPFIYSPIDPISNFYKYISNNPKYYLKSRVLDLLLKSIDGEKGFLIERMTLLEKRLKNEKIYKRS